MELEESTFLTSDYTMKLRKWQSTPVLLPGKSHGQRSLGSYSPWGRKELDTTERLYFLTVIKTEKQKAQKQKHRPMEQDRKPGNKPMHLWVPYF